MFWKILSTSRLILDFLLTFRYLENCGILKHAVLQYLEMSFLLLFLLYFCACANSSLNTFFISNQSKIIDMTNHNINLHIKRYALTVSKY